MKKFGFILMALCIATSAFAFGPDGDGNKHKNNGRNRDGHQMMDKKSGMCSRYSMFDDVDLSQEQKDKMKAIRKKNRDQVFEIDTDIQKAKIDKRVNMKKHDFAKAKSNVKKISELRGKKEALKIDMMQDCYNVLTKEQKAKL